LFSLLVNKYSTAACLRSAWAIGVGVGIKGRQGRNCFPACALLQSRVTALDSD
jgi:hypothetical protein